MWIVATLSADSGEDRAEVAQGLGMLVIFIVALMYLGAIIALAIDPTSRPDYLRGQHQLLKGPDDPNLLNDHPYYGLFFFDLLCMCVPPHFMSGEY
jgi:hypothetical protein